jgi:hypothetical protein
MQRGGTSVIVLAFLMALGKLQREADGRNTGGNMDNLFKVIDFQDAAVK